MNLKPILASCLAAVALIFTAGAATTNRIDELPLTNTVKAADELLVNVNNGSSYTTMRATLATISNLIAQAQSGGGDVTTAQLNTASNALRTFTIGTTNDLDATLRTLIALQAANATNHANAATNALSGVLRTLITATSNALYSAIGGGGGATTLDGLTDVTLTSPSSGQVLKYNGSQWVNGTDNNSGGAASVPYNYLWMWSPTNAWRYIYTPSRFFNNFTNFSNPMPLADPLTIMRQGQQVKFSGVIFKSGGTDFSGVNTQVVATPLGFGASPARSRRALAAVNVSNVPLSAYGELKETNTLHLWVESSADYVDMTADYNSFSGLSVVTNMYGGTNLTLGIYAFPPIQRPTMLVLYLHGNGSEDDGWETDLVWKTNKYGITTALAADGAIIVAPRADGNAWGSGQSYAEVTNAYHWATNVFNVTNVTLVGNSMGGLLTLRCLANEPWATRAYLIEPVCSLSNMAYASTFTNEIRGRYGYAANYSDYATVTAGFDPLTFSSNAFAGDRIFIRSSPSDTVVNQASNSVAFLNRFGASASITITNASGDHGSVDHFNGAETSGFVFGTIQ